MATRGVRAGKSRIGGSWPRVGGPAGSLNLVASCWTWSTCEGLMSTGGTTIRTYFRWPLVTLRRAFALRFSKAVAWDEAENQDQRVA
jgi:hypothetical protein